MTTYMEYKEVRLPSEFLTRLEELSEAGDPDNPPVLSGTGFFDWLNKLAKTEGWRMVWSAYNYPYIVLEREIALEENEK